MPESFTRVASLESASSHFTQIDNIPTEWQYLFDLAGITPSMLHDKRTLQFILDTVYSIGGAPKRLDQVQHEALSEGESRGMKAE